MFAARVIGHRGCAAHAPENTLAGIREAAKRGVTWVEIDVCLLGDGTPVIIHDASVDRTTNATGSLAALDWDRISGLDAGGWFAPAFAGERVPRLDQALAAVNELGLGLDLELKVHDDEGRRLVTAVVPVLRAASLDRGRFMASSFDVDALTAFHEAAPDLATAALFGRVPDHWQAITDRLGAVAVDADYRRITEGTVRAIKQAGLDVYLYTPRTPADVERMWAWGIDGVFADDPELFL